MTSFSVGRNDFIADGEPIQVLSGALHYFRIHPDQWADRIRKARELGLNMIETYIPWNAHSPTRDEFLTEGMLDLGGFLDEIAAQGMYAFVRPGPYICAEWSGGGLPVWLFGSGAAVRRNEPTYMAAVDDYYAAIAEIVVPRQVDRGGPVALVQVENEYGAYGDDKDYLRELVRLLRGHGITTPLTTVDQPEPQMLEAGSLPQLLRTGSFGSGATARLATLRQYQPIGPLMCSEFWNGWFDSWGRHHHTTGAERSARELDALLAAGASVNLYMLCGGTNFGFTNGANHKGNYVPIATSYDYDAPLDEAGRPTRKYWAFRDVLAQYVDLPAVERTPNVPAPSFSVPLRRQLPLWDTLEVSSVPTSHDHLPTMDELALTQAFVVYRPEQPLGPGVLEFGEVRDRAQVFVDRSPVSTLSRDHNERRTWVPGGRLEVLVEEMGRVNYGPRIGEPKGLIGPALLDGKPVEDWEVLPLEFDLPAITRRLAEADPVEGTTVAGPSFLYGVFGTTDAEADHFLDTSDWGKGVAWVNGFNLGRFWSRGPQSTLYVPAPVLRESGNELVVLVLDAGGTQARFVEDLVLGPTEE